MEAAVEVALPAAVAVARLMGSPEGLGSGGVMVGEVRWGTKDTCGSGGRNDDIHAVNISAPSFWRKIPDSKPCMEVSQPYNLHIDDVSNEHNLVNMNTHPPTLDVDVNLEQKSGKIDRKSSGLAKTSGMVHNDSSKSKRGLHDVNGIPPEVASSSASRNVSDKNQLIKQKNSSSSRRGDKRNSKLKNKNGCDSFSLKNGLVGFNSAAGGNNFFGMYGLKPDVFDITKFVKEPSLHELLQGSYTSHSIAKDKGKMAASSNNDLLQSVRNACSVLQARKVFQAQNCAEADNSCIQRVSSALVTVNSVVGQTDGGKGDCYTADLSSSNKVHESHDKIKMSSVADSPVYTPKEILEHLALPPARDLVSLLSDASKTTSSSKTSSDLRLCKSVPNRTGLPPFPWSNSFSGHSKSVSDAVKLSTCRTTCHGRWVKVKNSSAQKGSADLLVDFETLAFDQSLVPSTNLKSQTQENKFARIERAFSTPVMCSISEVPADDEHSPTYTAAQTLIDMASFSKENPCPAMKKPCQITMKSSKSKATKRPNYCDTQNTTIRPTNSLKVGDFGLSSSSKKPKISSDVTSTEPMRKGKLHQSFKSPPRKQFRAPNANTDNYSDGINLVKKSPVLKTARSTERPPVSTRVKIWKPPSL